MSKKEAGKETGTEKVQGKRGREINKKAGNKATDMSATWLGGQGTAEILMGFLTLRVTNSLTDRDTPTYTDSHTHTCTYALHAVHRTDCGCHYNVDFLQPIACS